MENETCMMTVEQYEEIKEGLEKVEKMLNDTAFAKMEEKVTLLEDTIEKQNKTIEDLSRVDEEVEEKETFDVEKMKGTFKDVLNEVLGPLEERLEKVENSPIMKGSKDADDNDIQKMKGHEEKDEGDLLGDIIRDSYVARRG